MASTYSNLKIELIGTGDQSGTWGNTTNTNLGTAIEEAITGSADVPFSSADVTLTLTNTNTAQTARNLRLNLTGTSGGARNLIVPAIEKQYIINNGLADDVTVKNSTGTGVAVPAGKSLIVFNNGTNVVEVSNALATGTVLPVANGGTGNSSYTTGDIIYASASGTLSKLADVATGNALISGGVGVAPSYGKIGLTTHVSGTLPVANGGTGVTTSTGTGNVVLSTSPTLTTPILGTPTSGTLTNCTGLSLTTGVTGTLPVANGGTGVTTSTGTGNVVLSTSPTLVTPILGTPTSGTLTSCTGLPLTTGVTGTLPVANGGTGVTTSTGTGNVVLSASPTLTGTPLSTTAAPGTNTTQIATTAFVGAAVTAATSSLGTMATQNANNVAITGGSITGITDLAVADGGTGASTITANSVILGNGTSALSGNLVAPGTSGNVLTSNGTTWSSAAVNPALFMLAADGNATATRSVFLTAGTWQIVLQDAGNYQDGGNISFTVTRNATVSTTTVTTTYNLIRAGGSGYGRNVYGTDNAVGTLTVAAGGATVTMSIAAPVVTGSGSPTAYSGAILWVNRIS